MDNLIMCVYYTSIKPDYKGDDNLAYIEVDREIVEDFYKENVCNGFHSKIGESTFENWLIEYTADETINLFSFAFDRANKLKVYPPIKNVKSFIDDEEKMIDFFTLDKEAFLEFYSYLTEEDYKATCEDVIKKSGYWHTDWYEDNPDLGGRALKDICFGIMVTEWLKGKA